MILEHVFEFIKNIFLVFKIVFKLKKEIAKFFYCNTEKSTY